MNSTLGLIPRKSATEGMVLVKNEEKTLPLNKTQTIAIIGNGCFDYIKGGLGSADVTSEYTIDIIEGLKNCCASVVYESLEKKDDYGLQTCNEFAKQSKIALVSISRNSREGKDKDEENFYLSTEEKELFDTLEKSNFEKVIVILNIASIIDVASIAKYSKVKSILITWLAGMEGGNAICDVLYGDVTPSGKLTDTIAYDYSDYPSARSFKASPMQVCYEEDIFVGYRYFETFKKEKVAYPFGFGLSYTIFEYQEIKSTVNENKIMVSLTVKNTGSFAGKEIVQVYSSSPKTNVMKPAIELRAYKKTRLLQPNESQSIVVTFDLNDMVYFDEPTASFILEKGEYSFFVGPNVRDVQCCGKYVQEENKTVYQTTLKFSFGSPYKLNAEGKLEPTKYWTENLTKNDLEVITSGDESNLIINIDKKEEQKRDTQYTLYDVADGKLSLDDFVKQLSSNELIDMANGQPPALIRGTAGIGNLSRLKIPNPQTADGPAGIRSTIPTLCFPCATLFACTWNDELLEEVGSAIGQDAMKNGVDILLAPGLNIHRNPLCGRNFEYYSEDPVVSGRSAAAIVRGVQSTGVCATIKHFAINNKEENRHESNSILSERAIRDIYLKGFYIAIKESNPFAVMTSYNLINGVRASAHAGLIKGILREEWGYDGLVMTDWHVRSHLWQEITAGSNLKMPTGYADEISLAQKFYSWNLLVREELEDCAKYVLKAVMKTRRFKEANFGKTQKISDFNVLDFICLYTTVSGTKIEKDGSTSLMGIGFNNHFDKVFVDYRIENDNAGEYILKINASVYSEGQSVDIYMDGEKVDEIMLDAPEYNIAKFFTFESKPFMISEGVHEIRSIINGAKIQDGVHYKKWEFEKV